LTSSLTTYFIQKIVQTTSSFVACFIFFNKNTLRKIPTD